MDIAKRKPIVGETLFVVTGEFNNLYQCTAKVTKSGYKFFHISIDGNKPVRIKLSSWEDRWRNVQVYETSLLATCALRTISLADAIGSSFIDWRNTKHSLANLEKVAKILGIEVKTIIKTQKELP